MATTTKHRKKKVSEQKPEVITAYKGFDANFQCRGYQYAVGGTYEHDGKVKACNSGFHSCEYPLDVFAYYEPATSVYAKVEASGSLSRHDDDSKVASARLSVTAQITIPDLVSNAVQWIMDRLDMSIPAAATNTGYRSAATNTGDRSAATVEGRHSVAIATGYAGKAKAAEGSAIVVCYRNENYELVHIRAAIAGRDGIKPDTFYSLDVEGNFVEAA